MTKNNLEAKGGALSIKLVEKGRCKQHRAKPNVLGPVRKKENRKMN